MPQIIKNNLNKFSLMLLALFSIGVVSVAVPQTAFAAASDCKRTDSGEKLKRCLEDQPIIKRLKTVVNFLAAGVGVVVTGSIIWGGLQYASAGGNANTISAAKKRIADSLIALIAFIFTYAFLQWILPGGLIF
jgi:hypothetical protein